MRLVLGIRFVKYPLYALLQQRGATFKKAIAIMRIVTLILGLLAAFSAQAQPSFNIHWVGFSDKANSPYSLFHPEEYLSPRALERRAKQGIPIEWSDLPVDPNYVQQLREKGLIIRHQSKWLNGVVVEAEPGQIKAVSELPFVQSTRALGYARYPNWLRDDAERNDEPPLQTDFNYYGYGRNQIEMLNGHLLHRLGYRGEGMQIAVFDGGFSQLDISPAFDSLRSKLQILGTHDFVEGDQYVYEASDHGTYVMSTIASNMPYLLVGTAPEASFYLFKTEDEKAEYLVEEYYWLAAAEKADSLGVDVINSSLGYNKFDDQDMSHSYADLDGNTTVITQAADLAARKGILVVTSAGNEGRGKWEHITAPGDADSVLTVGAVDRDGYYAKFSSRGFPKHLGQNKVKPNVMARGKYAIVCQLGRKGYRPINGTSFSSPITAGMITSLWQSMPDKSNMEIMQAVERQGSQVNTPDIKFGYGIPDYFTAYKKGRDNWLLLDSEQPYYQHDVLLKDKLHLLYEGQQIGKAQIDLFDMVGKKIWTAERAVQGPKFLNHLACIPFQDYPAGLYRLRVDIDGSVYSLYISSFPLN